MTPDDYIAAITKLSTYIYIQTDGLEGDEYILQLSYELERIYNDINLSVYQMRELTKIGEE